MGKKRIKGYFIALAIAGVLIVVFSAKPQKIYTFDYGVESEIVESDMQLEEYWKLTGDITHLEDASHSQTYFQDVEMEEAIGRPENIKKYVITKNYNDWFTIQATAITWKDETKEAIVFAYTELIDESGLVKYRPFQCDRMDVENEIFGYFRYSIILPNNEKKIDVDELRMKGFKLSKDENKFTMEDDIMLIKDREDENLE